MPVQLGDGSFHCLPIIFRSGHHTLALLYSPQNLVAPQAPFARPVMSQIVCDRSLAKFEEENRPIAEPASICLLPQQNTKWIRRSLLVFNAIVFRHSETMLTKRRLHWAWRSFADR